MAMLERYKTKGMWWFRIFGYGLHCKDVKIYPLLFSEREGHKKYLKIGRWIIKWLKNENRKDNHVKEENKKESS